MNYEVQFTALAMSRFLTFAALTMLLMQGGFGTYHTWRKGRKIWPFFWDRPYLIPAVPLWMYYFNLMYNNHINILPGSEDVIIGNVCVSLLVLSVSISNVRTAKRQQDLPDPPRRRDTDRKVSRGF